MRIGCASRAQLRRRSCCWRWAAPSSTTPAHRSATRRVTHRMAALGHATPSRRHAPSIASCCSTSRRCGAIGAMSWTRRPMATRRSAPRSPRTTFRCASIRICVRICRNRYEDYGWPATVVFAADGTEIVKRQGFVEPERFLRLLKAIEADPSPETADLADRSCDGGTRKRARRGDARRTGQAPPRHTRREARRPDDGAEVSRPRQRRI